MPEGRTKGEAKMSIWLFVLLGYVLLYAFAVEPNKNDLWRAEHSPRQWLQLQENSFDWRPLSHPVTSDSSYLGQQWR